MSNAVHLAGALALATGATLAAAPVAIRVANRFGFVDQPYGWKTHSGNTPHLGGLAVLAGLVPATLIFADGISRFGLLLAVTVAAGVLGTIDDRVNAPALLRVVCIAGLAFIWSLDQGWAVFQASWANSLLTVVWTLGVVNAINLLDLLDGSAGAAATAISVGAAVLAALDGDFTLAALALAVAGSCAGFLGWNLRRPSRIFLGDGGSMPLGLIVAAVVAMLPWGRHIGPLGILSAILLVGLPVFDMTFRVYSRIRRGDTVMTAGPDSIANWLRARLRSPREVALAIGTGQLLLCAAAIASTEVGRYAVALTSTLVLGLGAVLILQLDRSGFGRHLVANRTPTRIERRRRRHAVEGAPISVLRIISRLNYGGATVQAIMLSHKLSPQYRTTLLRGLEGPREGHMEHLLERYPAQPRRVPGLRRDLGLHDLRALVSIVRTIRRERPAVLHTHTAKAGTVGRLAALLAGTARPPVVVHTFHGHVLSGYFSPLKSRLFAWIERRLARCSTALIAVSSHVRDDLLELRIGSPDQVKIVHLGFDLDDFHSRDDQRSRDRARIRAELEIPSDARLVTCVARLVPIKRVDRFLRMAVLLSDLEDVRFLVVGGGELDETLRCSPEARLLGDRLVWTGFRTDISSVCFASDLVALTSDNEGTPVTLIEAQAAAVPVVSTSVGGVCTAVLDGVTGRVAAVDDDHALAAHARELLENPDLATAMGQRGRAYVTEAFSAERLVADIDAMYRDLLGRQAHVPISSTPQRPASEEWPPEGVPSNDGVWNHATAELIQAEQRP